VCPGANHRRPPSSRDQRTSALAGQLTDVEQVQVDEIRAKQLTGVRLTLPEARLLIKAEHSAHDQGQRRRTAEQQEAARAQKAAAAKQTLATPSLVSGLLAGSGERLRELPPERRGFEGLSSRRAHGAAALPSTGCQPIGVDLIHLSEALEGRS
jgi:hypothetical protein